SPPPSAPPPFPYTTLFRSPDVQPLAVQRRTFAPPRDPLLAGAEVVDVAEMHIAHALAVGDGDRHREEGDPALGVQRSVDRIDDRSEEHTSELQSRFDLVCR